MEKFDLKHLNPHPGDLQQVKDATIDSGAMGMVYRAVYKRQFVAVKVPHNTKEAKEAFKQECDLLSKLKHPNIAGLFGYSLEGGAPCMVIELAERGSLFDLLRDEEKKLEWRYRLSIACNIGHGIVYLHTQNPTILHRDLKSRNILLRKNGTAFIADFGISKFNLRATGTKFIGSPQWVAPEMMSGDDTDKTGTPLDVYGFGLILYELLTRDEPPMDQYLRRPTIPGGKKACQGCPQEYIPLMQECWEQKASDRPRMKEVVARLESMQVNLDQQQINLEMEKLRKELEIQKQVNLEKEKQLEIQKQQINLEMEKLRKELEIQKQLSNRVNLEKEQLIKELEIQKQQSPLSFSSLSSSSASPSSSSPSSSSSSSSSTSTSSSSSASTKSPSKIRWDSTPLHSFTLPQDGSPTGITTDNKHLFLCDDEHHSILTYTLNGQLIKQPPLSDSSSSPSPTLSAPYGIDIDERGVLYVIDENKISFCDREMKLLSSFSLPHTDESWRGIKVDKQFIYFTIDNHHQIFVSTHKGVVTKKFGKKSLGSREGEFNQPIGLTLDEHSLYICDRNNHRIQVLEKEKGLFQRKLGVKYGTGEGEFSHPQSIYLLREEKAREGSEGGESVLCIGDNMSVQMFTVGGVFLQRLGGKKTRK